MRGLLLITLFLVCAPARGEYWLSNRFAQNCAGCHAPGRINKAFADRRCTLSCQGCHVNPNGGGLRNRYGAWNEEKWLRSFRIEGWLANSKRPVPFGRHASSLGEADESQFPRGESEKIIAKTDAEYLARIPADDPYRTERHTLITGGVDLRYMNLAYLEGPALPSAVPGYSRTSHWLMTVDFGVRVRPIPEHLAVVFESRYLTPPTAGGLDQPFTTEPRIRSAYVLADSLPFNSYAMAGLYRPMFGLYDPNHDSLSNTLTGLNSRALYKAVGVGAAPNVPFANFNVLFPITAKAYDQSSGFVFNVGGRWVILGASLVFSYWNTNADTPVGRLNRNMLALTGGITFHGLIWNLELANVKKEFAPGLSDTGTVLTNQLKYRVWEENYVEFNYAIANTAQNLKNGTSNELMVGFRSFLISGLDLELLYVNRYNRTDTGAVSAQQLQLMAHIFL